MKCVLSIKKPNSIAKMPQNIDICGGGALTVSLAVLFLFIHDRPLHRCVNLIGGGSFNTKRELSLYCHFQDLTEINLRLIFSWTLRKQYKQLRDHALLSHACVFSMEIHQKINHIFVLGGKGLALKVGWNV